jgi:phage terminase large subunit GpA-like protein
MAGEPIMILGRDEFDKYRDATEKESNAFRLVGRRTASFGRQCRILDCTTPTVENADGWRALLGGTYHRLYVPCPHCATASEPFAGDERNQGWQILTIEQFRYPLRGKNGDEAEELCDWQTRIRKETVYVCRDCGQPIAEAKRWRMVCHGQWVPTNPEAEYDSYHLPSWYARTPTNSFGEVAARYVEGQEDPEAARDWFNADAAEPYRDIGHNAKEELVRHHCSDDYELGTVPTSRPCLLVATSDLHNLVHYCAVWAFTPERTYLIDCLKVETCEAIGALAGKTYPTLDGQELVVEAVFPDAQYRTSEVYELAVRNPAVIPTTGSARGGVISWTKASHYPSTDRELDRVIDVLNTNDIHFKEQLLLRYQSGVTDAGFDMTQNDWVLPRNVPAEFVRHMLAEVVVDGKNSRGFPTREWRRLGPNHYFDNAKYALAARYVLTPNLRELAAANSQARQQQQATQEPEVYGQKPEGW